MSLETFHKVHKTWKNINSFLLKNETMSDCAFLVEEGATVTKIPAHKYVLGAYSAEFYSLFYLMEADSNEIPINDVSVENFSKFLEFVYTETTELSLENVGELLKLAVNYSVDTLKDFCEKLLIKSVNKENVFPLMEKYSALLPDFEISCIKTIRRNEIIFEDPSFYDLSIETLTNMLKSEELGLKEIVIFNAVNKWSEHLCIKNNLVINSANKRTALGPALKFIRFGTMTNKEFSSCTFSLENQNPILTPTEMCNIFNFIISSGQTECEYSGKRRSSKTKLHLLINLFDTKVAESDFSEYVNLIVTKPIQLYGIGILGRADLLDKQNPEKFIIKLLDENRYVVNENIVEVRHDGTNKIYELFFNNPTSLIANKQYAVDLEPEVSGSFRYYTTSKRQEKRRFFVNGGMCTSNVIDSIAGLIFEDNDV